MAEITVSLPVMTANVYNDPTRSGDTAIVIARLTPSRAFGSLTASIAGSCTASTGTCRFLVSRRDSVELQGVIAGVSAVYGAVKATVTLDTLGCLTGDDLLDRADARRMIDSVWKLGGDQVADSLRREREAFLVDSAGILQLVYAPPLSASTPCSMRSWVDTLFLDPGFALGTKKLVGQVHTHPISPKTPVPSACGTGQAGTGPSYADWNYLHARLTQDSSFLAPNFKMIVVHDSTAWTFDAKLGAGGSNWKLLKKGHVDWATGIKLTADSWFPKKGPDTKVKAYHRTYPSSPLSCYQSTSQTPTLKP